MLFSLVVDMDDILFDEVLPEVEEVEQILSENEIKEGDIDGEKELFRSVYFGDDSNNLLGSKAISLRSNLLNPYDVLLEDYDKTVLYENSSGFSSFGSLGNLTISNLFDYDYILIKYKYKTGSIVSEDFYSLYSSIDLYPSKNAGQIIYFGYMYKASGSPMESNSKYLYPANGGIVTASGSSNIYIYDVYGYKKKEVVEPEPTLTPSPGEGNTTINNYYTLSAGSLESDIMTKQLKDYNTMESLGVISIVFALGIGLYLLVRRSIFKWK